MPNFRNFLRKMQNHTTKKGVKEHKLWQPCRKGIKKRAGSNIVQSSVKKNTPLQELVLSIVKFEDGPSFLEPNSSSSYSSSSWFWFPFPLIPISLIYHHKKIQTRNSDFFFLREKEEKHLYTLITKTTNEKEMKK